MEENKTPPAESEKYKSALTGREAMAVLAYLPVHIWLLPLLLLALMNRGYLSGSQANFLCYGVGLVYMLIVALGFLRRDFDPLCDRPGYCLLQILLAYITMVGFNLCVSLALNLILGGSAALENPNNAAVMELSQADFGGIKAMAVFMAPVIEELMFRAGIFGQLRRYNRAAAYGLSMLAFSLYHVWAFAMVNPICWIYLLQYLPVSYLLCRCYERTESIWCPIFFHMLVNAITLQALSMLEELL